MRLTKFNVLFPFLFIVFDLAVLYFVTLIMHYLTFSDWTFHNDLITYILKIINIVRVITN